MLSCKAWEYGLDSISGCNAALEGSLRVTCEEGLAALWGFIYKRVIGSLFCTVCKHVGHGMSPSRLNLVIFPSSLMGFLQSLKK